MAQAGAGERIVHLVVDAITDLSMFAMLIYFASAKVVPGEAAFAVIGALAMARAGRRNMQGASVAPASSGKSDPPPPVPAGGVATMVGALFALPRMLGKG